MQLSCIEYGPHAQPPRKGVDEDNFVVKLVLVAIPWLGCTRLMVKADNEFSLQQLVKYYQILSTKSNDARMTSTTAAEPM